MRARLFLGFLTLLAPLLATGAAFAQPAQPLDRLLPQIRRDHPGQFLDAEGTSLGGNPHYRLKWLTPEGRVLWLDADARTGRVVNQAPDRGFNGPRFRNERNDDEQAAPSDRRGEGRDFGQRNERPDDSRFGNRSRFNNDDGNGEERRFTRPGFGQRDGGERPGFGNRFERGGNAPGGNARNFGGRDFGGGGFGRSDRGNRNFGGERRGNGR